MSVWIWCNMHVLQATGIGTDEVPRLSDWIIVYKNWLVISKIALHFLSRWCKSILGLVSFKPCWTHSIMRLYSGSLLIYCFIDLLKWFCGVVSYPKLHLDQALQALQLFIMQPCQLLIHIEMQAYHLWFICRSFREARISSKLFSSFWIEFKHWEPTMQHLSGYSGAME